MIRRFRDDGGLTNIYIFDTDEAFAEYARDWTLKVAAASTS